MIVAKDKEQRKGGREWPIFIKHANAGKLWVEKYGKS